MAQYSDFFPLVIPYAPDCTEPLAEEQIKNATIEFYARTAFAKQTCPLVPVSAGTSTVTLTLPTDHTIEKIFSAYYDDWPLITGSEDAVARRYGYNWRIAVGTPRFILNEGEETCTLVPQPQAASQKGVLVRVTLRPTRDSTTCKDVIYERYAEHIAAGALAKLYAIPGQSWTAPGMITAKLAKFEEGISLAKQDAGRGVSRSRTIARPHAGNL